MIAQARDGGQCKASQAKGNKQRYEEYEYIANKKKYSFLLVW